jgi:glyoxylase-like metal-dependent hydrolase (beta-lactamase superfamily II)
MHIRRKSLPRSKNRNILIYPICLILVLPIFLMLVQCSVEKKEDVEEPRSELIQPGKWWEKLPRPVYAKLEKVETGQTWFEVYKLLDDTFAIYEPFQFEEAISYLVIGKDKAVVIDTGTGIGNLKQVVSELTHMPISVVNTHGHWDHIGNNYQFEEIACFNNDYCIGRLRSRVENSSLQSSITGDSIWKPLPEGFDATVWEIPPVEPTTLLEEGALIDLGDRTLEVIHTPGHSPGSICLLDKKNRILFTGDTFFPGPLYAYPDDVDIEAYIASVEKMKSRIDEYDYLCSGHNDPWVKGEVISRVSDAFQEIMAGKGKYNEDKGIRRYYYEGFDILIRADMIKN